LAQETPKRKKNENEGKRAPRARVQKVGSKTSQEKRETNNTESIKTIVEEPASTN